MKRWRHLLHVVLAHRLRLRLLLLHLHFHLIVLSLLPRRLALNARVGRRGRGVARGGWLRAVIAAAAAAAAVGGSKGATVVTRPQGGSPKL